MRKKCSAALLLLHKSGFLGLLKYLKLIPDNNILLFTSAAELEGPRLKELTHSEKNE